MVTKWVERNRDFVWSHKSWFRVVVEVDSTSEGGTKVRDGGAIHGVQNITINFRLEF